MTKYTIHRRSVDGFLFIPQVEEIGIIWGYWLFVKEIDNSPK